MINERKAFDMESIINPARAIPALIPLHDEQRAAISTAEAAAHLNRRPQTLRGWACLENGPLRPVRVHGRLAWRTADLRRLLGVAE